MKSLSNDQNYARYQISSGYVADLSRSIEVTNQPRKMGSSGDRAARYRPGFSLRERRMKSPRARSHPAAQL